MKVLKADCPSLFCFTPVSSWEEQFCCHIGNAGKDWRILGHISLWSRVNTESSLLFSCWTCLDSDTVPCILSLHALNCLPSPAGVLGKVLAKEQRWFLYLFASLLINLKKNLLQSGWCARFRIPRDIYQQMDFSARFFPFSVQDKVEIGAGVTCTAFSAVCWREFLPWPMSAMWVSALSWDVESTGVMVLKPSGAW